MSDRYKQALAVIKGVCQLAIKSKALSEDKKAEIAAAIGYLETFPAYLVSSTMEDLDKLMQEQKILEDEAIKVAGRVQLAKIEEITTEARYKHERDRWAGDFQRQQKSTAAYARAVAEDDETVKELFKIWFTAYQNRLSLENLYELKKNAANLAKQRYYLTRDHAAGKIHSETGG